MESRLNNQDGYATILVLGVALVISSILIASGVVIRWHSFATKNFTDDISSIHAARNVVYEGIALLLADEDTEIDWVGENWATVRIINGHNIVIEDEGSKLGVNWMSENLWHSFANYYSINDHIDKEAFWPDLQSVKSELSLTPDSENILTFFSSYNINAVDRSILSQLWRTVGAASQQSVAIAEEIISLRAEDNISGYDQLYQIPSINSQLIDAVLPWLALEGPININTASEEVLTILGKSIGIHDDTIQRIVNERQVNPLRNSDDLFRITNLSADEKTTANQEFLQWLTYKSRFFRITVETKDSKFLIQATVERKWVSDQFTWEVMVKEWKVVSNNGEI